MPQRHKSTPLVAVARALPDVPWKHRHSHRRAVVVAASAIAGLAVATAAGAVLFTHHDKPDRAEAKAPDRAEA